MRPPHAFDPILPIRKHDLSETGLLTIDPRSTTSTYVIESYMECLGYDYKTRPYYLYRPQMIRPSTCVTRPTFRPRVLHSGPPREWAVGARSSCDDFVVFPDQKTRAKRVSCEVILGAFQPPEDTSRTSRGLVLWWIEAGAHRF